MYSRITEDEPSGSKHVEDIINWNISLEKVRLVGSYCINKVTSLKFES